MNNIMISGFNTLNLIGFKNYDGNQISVGYHDDPDGIIGAVCIKAALKKIFKELNYDEDLNDSNVEYIPLQYGKNGSQNIEKLQGKNLIIFIDFCPKLEELNMLKEHGSTHIHIYDHHKTAKEMLESNAEKLKQDNIEFHFDMEKAGCTIGYNQFVFEEEFDLNFITILKFLSNYAEDRDLWKWNLENSKEINIGMEFLISFLKKDVELIYKFLDGKLNIEELELISEIIKLEDYRIPNLIFDKLLAFGRTKLFFDNNYIEKIVSLGKKNKIPKINLFGIEMFILNNKQLISEVGNALTELNYPSVQWFIVHEANKEPELVLSFRSCDNLPDVSLVAKELGGGGHRNACGATLSIDNLPNLLRNKL